MKKSKILGALFLASISIGLQAQDLTKKVSLKLHALSTAALCQELSKATGMDFQAGQSVRRSMLFVSVQDVAINDLMAKVADAASAEWQREGSTFTLTRTPAIKKANQERVFASRLAGIVKSLEDYRKQLDNSKFDMEAARNLAIQFAEANKRTDGMNFDSGHYQTMVKLLANTPVGRAGKRVLLSVPAADLAQVGPNERVVFSSSPTKMQKALPASVVKQFASLVDEQIKFTSEVKRVGAGGTNGYDYMAEGALQDFSEPAKVLVIAENRNFSSNISVEIQFVTATGQIASSFRTGVGQSNNPGEDFMKPDSNDKDKPLDIDPDLKAISEALKPLMQGNGDDTIHLPASLIDKMKTPETMDPLDLGFTGLLQQVGDLHHENIVVACNDFDVMLAWIAPNVGPLTPKKILSMLKFPDNEVKEDGGWLTIKPSDPEATESNRVDRKSLGVFVRKALSNPDLTMDDYANFAQTISGQFFESLGMVYSVILTDRRAEQMDWRMLKFYGMLGPDQRQALAGMKPLSFGMLTEPQIKFLSNYVFGPDANFSYSIEAPVQAAGSDDETPRYYRSTQNEPTEAMPNGLPANGTLTMNLESKDSVFAIPKKGSSQYGRGTPNPIDATNLAWQNISKERLDLFPWASTQPEYEEFEMGHLAVLNFHFGFTKSLSMDKRVELTRLNTPSKRLKLADLPEAFRKDYEKALSEYRESFKNAKPGDYNQNGGRNIPPLHLR